MKTDFTTMGTSLLKENGHTFTTIDIEKVDNSTFVYLIQPLQPFADNIELWSSDGTALSDTLIATWPNSYNNQDGGFTNFNGEVYFFKNIGTTIELWKTKGTLATTHLIKAITTTIYPINGHIKLVELNNKLYFNIADSLNQSALWMTDGTTAGTSPIAFFENETINQSTYLGLSLNNALVYNDKMYFIAKNSLGWEAWVSDGTAAGTNMIYDLAAGSASAVSGTQPYFFSGHNNRVYFVANNQSSGDELFYINVLPLTINDNYTNDLPHQINIYPNPSNGMFTLANNSIESVSVKIMNMLGETVYANNGVAPTESKTIDLSRFAKGVYAVDVIYDKGASKKKIVVN